MVVVNGAQRDYRHNTGGIGHNWEVLDGDMVWWFSANNYFYINVHGEAAVRPFVLLLSRAQVCLVSICLPAEPRLKCLRGFSGLSAYGR